MCLYAGLFNGALGTVISFCFNGPVPVERSPCKETFFGEQPDAIVVLKMDDAQITVTPDMPEIVPFSQFPDTEHGLRVGGRRWVRKQFPLELAHASTIHKAQGITLKNKHAAVMPAPRPMFFGGDYVAISRVVDLDYLHLTAPVPEHRTQKSTSLTNLTCDSQITVGFVFF